MGFRGLEWDLFLGCSLGFNGSLSLFAGMLTGTLNETFSSNQDLGSRWIKHDKTILTMGRSSRFLI